MKVIAVVNKASAYDKSSSVYLAEVSGGELMNMQGEKSRLAHEFQVGAQVDVSDLFRTARQTIDLYGELTKNLSSLQGHLETFNRLLAARQPQLKED